MKKDYLKDLRNKNIKELFKNLKEEKERLLKLRFEVSQGKLKNISDIRKSKKKIARILTIISEKQWEEINKQGAKNGEK